MIDVHTGLGPRGADTLAVLENLDEKKLRSLKFDKTSKIHNYGASSSSGALAGYDDTMGTAKTIIKMLYKNCDTLAITQEFGTYPAYVVSSALIAENAVYWFGSEEEK